MNVWKNTLLGGALALVTLALPTAAQTSTSTLSLALGAQASLSVTNTATTLTQGAVAFSNWTGVTSFTFKMRTKKTGGTGSITAGMSEFTATGATVGPKVASHLTYGSTTTVTGPTPTASGTAAALTNMNILTGFSENFHTPATGASGAVNWTLVDDESFETGNWSSVVTFTISAA